MADLLSAKIKVIYDSSNANLQIQKEIVNLEKQTIKLTPDIDFAKTKIQLKAQINTLSNELQNSLKIQGITISDKQSLQLITSQYKEYSNAVKTAQKETESFSILQNKITGATGNFQNYINSNVKIAKAYPEEINKIKQSFLSLSNETDFTKLSSGFKNIQSEISSLKGIARSAGLEGQTVLEKFKSDMGNFVTFLGAGTVLMAGVNQIKQMVSTIEDLNKAATDLQMVTGNNSAQTAQLLTQYNQLATQLGATTVEVADSASEWLNNIGHYKLF